jgi:hypothetical protein
MQIAATLPGKFHNGTEEIVLQSLQIQILGRRRRKLLLA